MRGQDFDCDVATEARIAGAVDFTHAAGAGRGLYLIGSEFRAMGEGHVRSVGIIGRNAGCNTIARRRHRAIR